MGVVPTLLTGPMYTEGESMIWGMYVTRWESWEPS